MEKILELKNLTKNYDSFEAVKGISFNIGSGEIVGLLGPNGAGKTTTISMVLGILEPTSGNLEVVGMDLQKQRDEILKQINFAAVYASLPGNMTVLENLTIFGLLYEVKNLKVTIDDQLKTYDLEKLRNTKVGVLSSGEQTRVALAKATLNKPKLLLLDEPTASLDPSTARLVRDSMKDYVKKNNAAILWTSHNMHEVEEVCDRVLFLSHGRILLQGVPAKLIADHNKKNLEELFIAVAREPLSLIE